MYIYYTFDFKYLTFGWKNTLFQTWNTYIKIEKHKVNNLKILGSSSKRTWYRVGIVNSIDMHHNKLKFDNIINTIVKFTDNTVIVNNSRNPCFLADADQIQFFTQKHFPIYISTGFKMLNTEINLVHFKNKKTITFILHSFNK